MNSFLIIVSLFFSVLTYGGDSPSETYMSLKEQGDFINEISKNIRKEYWVSGHQDVSSGVEFVTKKLLDDHVKKENRYESSLDSAQVSELYRCYYKGTCELYVVYVSGSYWGGYGESAHFVMIYTNTRKYFEMSHIIYAE